MDNDDDRTVELSSVEAIFPELVRHSTYSVSLEIPVPLSKPVRVIFPAITQSAPEPTSLHDTLSFQLVLNANEAKDEVHLFSNLPPLTATITLPTGYPSETPPQVELVPHEAWLPQSKLDELKTAALQIWEDMGRDMAVYSIIEHIQETAENCFDLAPNGTLDLPSELKVALLDYDCKTKQEKFDKGTFDCGICLEPKKGLVCHRIQDCGHVFCVGCLQDFYNNCITEGDVSGVKCLDPSCGKEPILRPDGTKRIRKPRKLKPAELLQIPISEEQVKRYVNLKRKRKLESNPNTIYCPREWCQGPARRGNQASSDDGDSDSDDENDADPAAAPQPEPEAAEAGQNADADTTDEDEPSYQTLRPPPGERLAICTDCSFAFCMVCKKSWHGEFGWCKIPEGQLSLEEKATMEYMKKYTMACPYCECPTQKIHGCNHMQCRQCDTHFCYLCSSWLIPRNPYIHFNTEGTPCYQRLFEGEEGDGAGAPLRREPPGIEVIFEDDPPDQPAPQDVPAAVPPPAPFPPQHGGGAHPHRGGGGRGQRRGEHGLAGPEPAGHGLQGHGIRRFLELAARDEEDGWDSDEMDEIEDELVRFALGDR